MSPDEPTMYERMLAGESYIADDPRLHAANDRAQSLSHRLNSLDPTDHAAVRAVLEELLGGLGEKSFLRPPFYCDYGFQTTIGARTFVNWGLTSLDVGRVSIGDDCQLGPGVQLLTATHPVEPEARRARWEASRPITLEDNVWLGGAVVVCPGVTIGADSVVGAGAVVTRDVPPGVVVAGNPARVLRPVR